MRIKAYSQTKKKQEQTERKLSYNNKNSFLSYNNDKSIIKN